MSLIVLVVVLFLLAMGWIRPLAGDRWCRAVEEYAFRLSARKNGVVIGIGVAAVLCRLAILPLEPVPLPIMHDEFSNLLAGDTFAHGRLANPPHPMWIFFDTFHVLQHPTYATKYPPAEGLVLAVGQVMGLPWLGNLLALGFMCMAMTWMLQGWVPPHWALLGAIFVVLRLCFFNYWFDGYLGGAIAALGAALVLGVYPRMIRRARFSDGLWMAAGALILALSRPLEGALFCLPVAAFLLLSMRHRMNDRAFWMSSIGVSLPPVLLVAGAGIAWLGYYNWRVTGHPTAFPYFLYHRAYFNFPVFAWQHASARLHYDNPQFEVFFNKWHGAEFQLDLSHWARRTWASFWAWWHVYLGRILTFPFLALPNLLRDRRMRLPLLQFLVCALGLVSVVWFQPHYAAPMSATLFLLLTQAMRHLRRFEYMGRPIGIYLSRIVVVAALDWVLVLAGHAARVPFIPWSQERLQIAKQLEATPGDHLVLVDYGAGHNVHQEWVYNAAEIDHSRIVWARRIPGRDLTPLLNYFAGRQTWVVYPDEMPPRLVRYTGPQQASSP